MDPATAYGLGLAALLWWAAGVDIRSRTIPNTVPILLLTAGIACSLGGYSGVSAANLAIGGGVGLALGVLLFYGGAMGGGDAKLCIGLGVACGWPTLFEVLFATAIAGGVVCWWAQRKDRTSVPYGPAFALGHSITFGIASLAAPHQGLWHAITGRPM